MSTLVENVAKVTAAHAALKTAISEKGVAVPDGARLTDMPALVGQISTDPVPNYPRAVFARDSATSIVVPKMMVVDMSSLPDLIYGFYSCTSLTSLTLPEGFGQNATNLLSCFNGCNVLESLTLPAGFGQNAANLMGCFNNCAALTSLTLPDGFGQNATTATNCFSLCDKLTDITGNPNFNVYCDLSDCTNLTHDSLMVVINGLQTVTKSTTLKLGSKNLAKLTDEEKKVATDKGWTLT